jgi:hypothetical protein
MISVESVFQNVLALSRKGSTGYSSSADFNAQQRMVQDTLFAYYFERYEKDQAIPDSLRPFIKQPALNCALGSVTLPSDYRHRLECQFGYTSGGSVTYHPCPYLAANEEVETMDSYIRKPSADKRRFYHTLAAGAINVLPAINGILKLKYLSSPANAVRGYTVDSTNFVENYSSGTSTNFAWEPQDETNLVDLFLYLKGISARQSELLQWVAQKRQLTT